MPLVISSIFISSSAVAPRLVGVLTAFLAFGESKGEVRFIMVMIRTGKNMFYPLNKCYYLSKIVYEIKYLLITWQSGAVINTCTRLWLDPWYGREISFVKFIKHQSNSIVTFDKPLL